MGRERVFRKIKSPITSVKLFGMEKVSGITKKKFKIGTLEDFEKTYVMYVAMAEKTLSSGRIRTNRYNSETALPITETKKRNHFWPLESGFSAIATYKTFSQNPAMSRF